MLSKKRRSVRTLKGEEREIKCGSYKPDMSYIQKALWNMWQIYRSIKKNTQIKILVEGVTTVFWFLFIKKWIPA